jgi:hypothetical protein
LRRHVLLVLVVIVLFEEEEALLDLLRKVLEDQARRRASSQRGFLLPVTPRLSSRRRHTRSCVRFSNGVLFGGLSGHSTTSPPKGAEPSSSTLESSSRVEPTRWIAIVVGPNE